MDAKILLYKIRMLSLYVKENTTEDFCLKSNIDLVPLVPMFLKHSRKTIMTFQTKHFFLQITIWSNTFIYIDTYPCPIFSIFVYFLFGSPMVTIVRNFSRISSSVILRFLGLSFLFVAIAPFVFSSISIGFVYWKIRRVLLKCLKPYQLNTYPEYLLHVTIPKDFPKLFWQ